MIVSLEQCEIVRINSEKKKEDDVNGRCVWIGLETDIPKCQKIQSHCEEVIRSNGTKIICEWDGIADEGECMWLEGTNTPFQNSKCILKVCFY
jgi:hypothetical protein